MMRTVLLSIVALGVAACSCGCDDTSVTRYETIKDAKADRLFERGWVPDVFPDNAGPLTEAHDIDTNARCALVQFSPGAFGEVLAGLSREGFERYEGALPPRPLRACPFGDSDVRHASTVLRRGDPNRGLEFVVVDRGGKLVFWGTR